MRHIALLSVITALLGGPFVGQVLSDYDDRYAEEVDWQENKQAMRHCQSCNPDECLTPTGCVAGVVKDPCQCCDVCGKAEFELCDHPQVYISVAREGQRGAIAPPKMPKMCTSLTKKVVAPNFYFSARKPAREAYSGHLWVRSEPPPQEECPLQDKFLAVPMQV